MDAFSVCSSLCYNSLIRFSRASTSVAANAGAVTSPSATAIVKVCSFISIVSRKFILRHVANVPKKNRKLMVTLNVHLKPEFESAQTQSVSTTCINEGDNI